MSTSLVRVVKRLLLGRAMRSDRLGETLLPKRIALPVFASDALSSVAYAPDEIFLTLLAGRAGRATRLAGRSASASSFVMLVVVASYRQNVHAYPSGGGDYEVATTNLGPPRPDRGQRAAGRLRADRRGVDLVRRRSTPRRDPRRFDGPRGAGRGGRWSSLLTAMNLRGVRESGHGVRHPDLRLHGRASSAWRAWGFVRVLPRRPARRRERAVRPSSRSPATTAAWPALAVLFLCCGPSPPAAPP